MNYCTTDWPQVKGRPVRDHAGDTAPEDRAGADRLPPNRTAFIVSTLPAEPGSGVHEAPCPDPPPAVLPDASRVIEGSGSGREKSRSVPLACQYNDKSLSWGEPQGVTACRNGSWTLELIRISTGEIKRAKYTCRSWRHEGDCRRWKGSQDFRRIESALKSRRGWVYVVLTFDRGNRTSEDKRAAYKRITLALQHLRTWLKRQYEGRVEYISLVEQHADGWPHVNVLIHQPGLVAAANADWQATRQAVMASAVRCGFGFRLWLEPVKNDQAIAGYFVKLCHEASKLNQAPISAPRKFRRLRASQGLLPPRFKDPDVTGQLVKRPIEELEKEDEIAAVALDFRENVCKNVLKNERQLGPLGLARGRDRDKEDVGAMVT